LEGIDRRKKKNMWEDNLWQAAALVSEERLMH
jgi:hypothetical protein